MRTTAPPEHDLPTVRSLGHDLLVLVEVRARAHLTRWRTVARAFAHAHAHAATWRCAALVGVILAISLWLAWIVWDSTMEHRESRAGAQSVGGRLEGSLATDLTGGLEAQRGAAPGEPRRGGGAQRQAGSDVPHTSPESSSPVGGWLLSLAGVVGVLVGGLVAAVAVLRRHSRRSTVPAVVEGQRTAAVLPDLEPREPDGPHELEQPAAQRSDADTVAGGGNGSPADARGFADEGASRDAFPLWVDSGVTPAGLSAHSTAVVAGQPVRSRIEARERLFERRAAPRIAYVHDGTLEWRGTHVDMTVRDLSGTGLRLRIAPGHASPLPAANDYVQVDFPIDGGPLRVAAQVAWRRVTPDGTEMGLVFRPLAGRDVERIRETCLARL